MTCKAPHPAYGDHEPCQLEEGHEEKGVKMHRGSTYTEPWSTESVRQFHPDHPWLRGRDEK